MSAFANDDDDAEFEVPDEEKLAIATHFLLSSPIGEFDDILADVKNMLPENLLTDAHLENIAQKYNVEQLTTVSTPQGGRMIICNEGRVDSTHFIDAAAGVVRGIDHVKRACIEGDEQPHAAGPLEDQRAELQAALAKYIENQYGASAGACGVYESGSNLVVVISGVKLNLRNFWGGNWRSTFTVNPGDRTLSGNVKIRIHYFEDGNVQMVSNKDVPSTPFSSGDMAAAAAAIAKEESAIQDSLEQMYINMAQETFKDMRRILPISKQKMDWTGAQTMLARGFAGE